jgi:serine/threonine protein phosphatase PrpC
MQHADRNIVTRALGVTDEVDPDVWFLPGGGRQCFVICSDGLTKEVGDDVIRTVLTSAGANESPAELLVAAALAAGGSDNVTVVVVEAELVREDGTPDHNAVAPPRLEETLPRMGAAS